LGDTPSIHPSGGNSSNPEAYDGASADQPDIDKTGCGYRFLTPIDSTSDSIKAQQEADSGQKNWVFDDPQHVASDALARFAHVEE
jgi:hypothetical protein